MTRSLDQFEELGQLTAVLCDGQLTPPEAARLEQLAGQSNEAREFFLRYLQLHGELYWETAVSAGRDTLAVVESALGPHSPDVRVTEAGQRPRRAEEGPKLPRRRIAAVATVASILLVALSSAALYRLWRPGPEQPREPEVVARLTATFEAAWSEGGEALEGEDLAAGRTLALDEGLAGIDFGGEARAILQGPARFELTGPREGLLHAGSLVANLAGEQAGLTIGTPAATVVDLGTEFGVAVDQSGYTEVHVFDGTVEVRSRAGSAGAAGRNELSAGEAVYVCAPTNGGAAEIGTIPFDSGRFVRHLSVPGTVAGFRALVAAHPRLIHHYTFEGVTSRERCRDGRGDLHLTKAVMFEGSGEGDLECGCDGRDATTSAIRPHRGSREGNVHGVALQTENEFRPPRAFTVELLLSFEGFPGPPQGQFGMAVATRQSEDRCGFFVVAADEGHLVHSVDARADWIESERELVPEQWYSLAGTFRVLVPGDWYYVASTFRVEGEQTRVNTYVANLSRGEPALHQLVRDQTASGAPAPGRLGIGMGFDAQLANAYPWCGSLDEVAIYDTVLDRKTLEDHLKALTVPRD